MPRNVLAPNESRFAKGDPVEVAGSLTTLIGPDVWDEKKKKRVDPDESARVPVKGLQASVIGDPYYDDKGLLRVGLQEHRDDGQPGGITSAPESALRRLSPRSPAVGFSSVPESQWRRIFCRVVAEQKRRDATRKRKK